MVKRNCRAPSKGGAKGQIGACYRFTFGIGLVRRSKKRPNMLRRFVAAEFQHPMSLGALMLFLDPLNTRMYGPMALLTAISGSGLLSLHSERIRPVSRALAAAA